MQKKTFGSWTRETTLPPNLCVCVGGGMHSDVLGKETSLAVLHYAEYCSNRLTCTHSRTIRGRLYEVDSEKSRLSQMTIMASEAGPRKRMDRGRGNNMQETVRSLLRKNGLGI